MPFLPQRLQGGLTHAMPRAVSLRGPTIGETTIYQPEQWRLFGEHQQCS